MGAYELIDHTADIGFRLKADGLKRLFAGSATAMFAIIAERKRSAGLSQSKKFIFDFKESSLEELYIAWLRELISLSDCENVIFKRFQIDKIDQGQLQAKALGYPRRHFHIIREIKAVTYHDLKVEKQGKFYKAEVIFDV